MERLPAALTRCALRHFSVDDAASRPVTRAGSSLREFHRRCKDDPMFLTPARTALALALFTIVTLTPAAPQDSATGSIRGTVFDTASGRIAQASIVVVNTATGMRYVASSDAAGRFVLDLLPPGNYSARVEASGMSPQVTPPMHVDIGGA